MRPAFRFAHFSDPHLPLLPGWPSPLHSLAGKRLLGFLSWRRKRHKLHRPDVLTALLTDVSTHNPDHVVVTGDLVNIAMPDEFGRARIWLEGLGPSDRVTIVPGNHDATVGLPRSIGLGQWQPWMTGDDGTTGFPFVRVRGPVALIGVSTAVPSLPLLATGTVGVEQLARLEEILADLSQRSLFRVVLMHHPPIRVCDSARKALTDGRRVQAVLARAGAELVLHGHHHREHVGYLPGPGATTIPVIGVSSASAAAIGRGQPACWVQFTVQRLEDDSSWRAAALVRGYDGSGFGTAAHFTISC